MESVSSPLNILIGSLLLASVCSIVLGKPSAERCLNCTIYKKTYYSDGSPASYIGSPVSYIQKATSIFTHECSGNACGTNAMCQEVTGNSPVCSCSPFHSGDPSIHCTRGECSDSVDCLGTLSSKNSLCVNTCIGACGLNANCEKYIQSSNLSLCGTHAT